MRPELPFDGEPYGHGEAPDGLLTIDELAAILKVRRSWIYLHTRKRSKTTPMCRRLWANCSRRAPDTVRKPILPRVVIC